MSPPAQSSAANVIVMLGIHPDSPEKGGISAVVDVYREAGLFSRWPIRYLGTVMSGSAARKVRVCVAALAEFSSLLVRGRMQLLHAQTSSRASFWRKSLFIVLAFTARRPVIVHLHGSEFEQFYTNECGPLRRRYISWILNRTSRVVVLSSQWAAFVRKIAPRANVVRIFNPIGLRLSDTAKRVQKDPHGVLFLGRFGRRKGILDLLQAMTIVTRSVPNVRLRCGGDGDIAGVERRIAELGLNDCVEVLGWVSGERKQQELARASVYVLPSYAEGLPMGILEAMAAGLPIVSTTIGGIPDAVDEGVEGFLIRPGDVDALAERIVRLLQDPALRAQMALAARETAVARFDADQVISQLEDLYRTLGAQPCDNGPPPLLETRPAETHGHHAIHRLVRK